MISNLICKFFIVAMLMSSGAVFSIQKPEADSFTPHNEQKSQNSYDTVQQTTTLSQDNSKKKEADQSGTWGPLMYIGATVTALYIGGAIVAGAVYLRIRDLLPGNSSSRHKCEEEE